MMPMWSNTTVNAPRASTLAAGVAVLALALGVTAAAAQSGRGNDAYRPPADPGYDTPAGQPYGGGAPSYGGQSYGAPPAPQGGYGQPQPPAQTQTYGQYGNAGAPPPPYGGGGGQPYGNQGYANNSAGNGGYREDGHRAPRHDGYGAPYSPPPVAEEPPPQRYEGREGRPVRGYYSQGEIAETGRGFFGSITKGLASAIEYTYQQAGRPNGYILGEDGGGAFFAGLRYGEGMLYTKDAGDHKVFWQGPSLGYDIGGEGSKVMVLVYDMGDPGDIYHRYGGVEGSAYAVGGVSVQFQKWGDVKLAVIRSGVGLRLGANIGYLKYSRSPTWNPF
jgi:hypothetical protein